ncbi:MAG: gamma-glutamyltransferase [Vicinamibacterales bacterium]|nr:gamma-glutamyltransferase [Vicinamibacterales bacterium]
MRVPPAARLAWVALGAAAVLWPAPGGWPGATRALARGGDEQAALQPIQGAQDPAWSPDGRRLALSVHERVRLAGLDGRLGDPLAAWDPPGLVIERDPCWSPDGLQLAFAADRGEGFDLFTVAASGGRPRRITFLPGDERWPSWSADGRIVFATHDGLQWDLATTDPDETSGLAPPRVERLTATADDEREPTVSPDGRQLAYVSDTDSEDGDLDLWVAPMPSRQAIAGPDGLLAGPAWRLMDAPGPESRPAWSADGRQLAFGGVRDGVGSVWAMTVVTPEATASAPRPAAPPVLVSRHFGVASWAPDGRSLALADLPAPQPTFNGEPRGREPGPPPAFAREGFAVRLLPAPVPADAGGAPLPLAVARDGLPWAQAFDRTWTRLRDRYYPAGEAAAAWSRLRDRVRPLALAAPDAAAFERRVDEMIASQPLVKAPVSSPGAVVVSGHRLASEAGARVLERGGNVADAAVAVSFALGVVEPDASGIGGDGMAIVWLASMPAPVVVDFKDQSPAAATLDNPRIYRDGDLVGEGPAAANIPGVVAGMDLLHRRFGSGKLAWADLVRPAAAIAEEGFVLDEALPSVLAQGRARLLRHPAAAEVFLPRGHVPRAGERFVNADLAATLRTIAAEGADAFYRGALARRIADDMAASGGLITAADLSQYRAVEREPLRGEFRGLAVYAAPPPVAAGAALVETLQILDHYVPPPPGRYDRQADVLHYAIEAWKAREPATRIADPAIWPVDLGEHLSRAHAAARFARIDPRRAGELPGLLPGDPAEGDDQGERVGRGTTAFVVADTAGNVVVVTQTLSTWGGSYYATEGLGFLYNNHLRGYRTAAGAYGHLRPLMRSSSMALPTMVFDERDGARRPRLAIASAGNAWIPASIYGVLSAVLDGGLPMQAAIEAPRFLVARDPADASGRRARVQIEDRFPRDLLDDLAARGHAFQKIGGKGELRYGFAAAVLFDPARGLVHAGTEPRRSHAAVAVPR